MKSILVAVVLTIGCTASDPAGDPQPGEMEVPAGCVAQTCDGAGVGCGTINDGCGGSVDCGACAGPQPECVDIVTCEGRCGAVDNGCGVMLQCGGCGDGESCISGVCLDDECGAEGRNACGGCGPLPVEPGDTCACGAVATCDLQFRQVLCDGMIENDLPETSDANDAWKTINGNLEGYYDADGIMNAGFGSFQSHHYAVEVDDTFYGLMQPELQYTGPAGIQTRVCMGISLYDGLLKCDDTPGFQTTSSCCKFTTTGALSFGTVLNNHIPNAFDDDLKVWISVYNYGEAQGGISESCDPYTVSYRF